jgi:hypothetical protein
MNKRQILWGLLTDTTFKGLGQKHFPTLKVPRQCPLVLERVREGKFYELKWMKGYELDFNNGAYTYMNFKNSVRTLQGTHSPQQGPDG